MTAEIRRSTSCHRDLVEIATYLDSISPDLAGRFLDSVDRLCEVLKRLPDLGSLYPTDKPSYAGLRVVAVPHFHNFLVFHRSVAGGVELVRVVHGSRDLAAALDDVS
jgi:toxin ParE1/3/4